MADDRERLVCAYTDPRFDSDPSWLPLDRVGTFAAVLTDIRWPAAAGTVLVAAGSTGQPAVLDGDIGPPELLLDLAGRATHTVFSAPGLILAAGVSDPSAVLVKLARGRAGTIGVTLVSEGFLWREGGVESRVSAYPIRLVDTLAAGDIWHGAFTWDSARRAPPRMPRASPTRRRRLNAHASEVVAAR